MRYCFLCALLCLAMGTTHASANRDMALEALQLTIQRNVEHRQFSHACPSGMPMPHRLEVDVFLVPINEEVIEIAVAYKAELEALAPLERETLLRTNRERYLDGDEASFILLVATPDKLHNDDVIRFEGFAEHVYLYDEHQKHPLLRYTHVFDGDLSPGWNKGYLYFENFRTTRSYSYSVHFDALTIAPVSQGSTPFTRCDPVSLSWAMSFDESDLGLLALLEKGLSSGEIREYYGIPTSRGIGLGAAEILSIVQLVLGVIAIAAAAG